MRVVKLLLSLKIVPIYVIDCGREIYSSFVHLKKHSACIDVIESGITNLLTD